MFENLKKPCRAFFPHFTPAALYCLTHSDDSAASTTHTHTETLQLVFLHISDDWQKPGSCRSLDRSASDFILKKKKSMSPLERCGELADHRISLVLVFKSSPLKPINKTCRQAVGARSPSELVGKDLISLLVFFFLFLFSLEWCH